MADQVRQWYIARALDSFSSLNDVLTDLTEKEVLHALALEAKAQRRRSMIDRLIQRAVRLKEIEYAKQLKEKYGGST